MSTSVVEANRVSARARSHFGVAWMMLCAALAVHVTDEALTDFLSVYNPTVRIIRAHMPIPLPTFSFDTWLIGLILGIVLVFSLSPFAFREARWMFPLSYVFGIMMTGNGLLHLGASIYMKRLMPGVYSSPLLLACSLCLLMTARNRRRRET